MSGPTVTDHGPGPAPSAFYDIGLDEIEVAQWCPDLHAQEPPEQVHLVIRTRSLKAPLVVRFKGPDTLGVIIEQLIRHRREVWPGAAAIGPEHRQLNEEVPAVPRSEVLADLLSLVDVFVAPEVVSTWTEAERTAAADWASAVYLSASDHDDIEVPEKPAFLPLEGRHG